MNNWKMLHALQDDDDKSITGVWKLEKRDFKLVIWKIKSRWWVPYWRKIKEKTKKSTLSVWKIMTKKWRQNTSLINTYQKN